MADSDIRADLDAILSRAKRHQLSLDSIASLRADPGLALVQALADQTCANKSGETCQFEIGKGATAIIGQNMVATGIQPYSQGIELVEDNTNDRVQLFLQSPGPIKVHLGHGALDLTLDIDGRYIPPKASHPAPVHRRSPALVPLPLPAKQWRT